jgi:hypothetical protein
MRSEIKRLEKAFEATPILYVDGDLQTARLAKASELPALQRSHRPMVLMGMPVALQIFQKLVKEEGIKSSSFTVNQLVRIGKFDQPDGKFNYAVAHSWFEADILVADGEGSTKKERTSSFTTAFACGVCGSLRRQGLPLPALKKVADLIRGIGIPEAEKVLA